MNQKELEKRTNEGVGYVLRLIVDRKIKDDEIAGKLMEINSVGYDNLGFREFEVDLRFCMNAAKYVKGTYSPTFPYFQAKAIDELVNDAYCNREFSIVDKVFDRAIEKVGETVLGQIDYFDEEKMIPNFKLTAKAMLNVLRMQERCRIRRGCKRTITTQEDLKKIVRDTCKILERRIGEHPDSEVRARSEELKKQYETLLGGLVKAY